jgi:hypothetical protein
MVQVGAIMPSSSGRWASQTEQQRITISTPHSYRQYAFTYQFPIGSSFDNIINVGLRDFLLGWLND